MFTLLPRTVHEESSWRAPKRTDVKGRSVHLRLGVVPITVRSAYVPAVRDLEGLYGGHLLAGADPEAIRIDVRATRRGRSLRRRFEVCGDGVKRFSVWTADGVLPHIEWAINWQIMLYLPRYYEIHAAVMELNGAGAVFAASPQSGKSTLALGLLARGWRYLSDEFALIDPDTLAVHPYPKALCIKEGSFGVMGQLGLVDELGRRYCKGKKGTVTFVPPRRFGEGCVGRPCGVRHVFFCRYVAGARPMVEPVSRAEAVLRLNRQSFNFLKFRRRGVALLCDLVRRARCYELISGEIGATCELVESVVGRE